MNRGNFARGGGNIAKGGAGMGRSMVAKGVNARGSRLASAMGLKSTSATG